MRRLRALFKPDCISAFCLWAGGRPALASVAPSAAARFAVGAVMNAPMITAESANTAPMPNVIPGPDCIH